MMIKIVVDTNILVSAIIFGGKPGEILYLIEKGEIIACISPFIIAEFKEVLRKKFDFNEEKLKEVESLINEDFVTIEPKSTVKIIKNFLPDNKILEACVEARADYLITGDKKHILKLKKIKTTRIVNPDEFLKLYRLPGSGD